MKKPLLVAGLLLALSADAQAQERKQQAERPAPSHANVAYGTHERNVLDLYLAEVDQPTPVVLFIHGGGFRAGDKSAINPGELRSYGQLGWSVAAINYRFTDSAPAPAQYLDCARALQFLRHNARKWNLDPTRVAATGGSAGAGTSLWLAFHDDLAKPDSDDPIARQSTRLTCAVVSNGQSSYDPRFAEKIGIPRPNFDRHAFFLPFYDLKADEIDTPKAYARYEEMAPITYLSSDDPPVMMLYSYPNTPVTKDSDLGFVVHHPLFGVALKERMDPLGIECVVQYAGSDRRQQIRHGSDGPVLTSAQFIQKQFERGK